MESYLDGEDRHVQAGVAAVSVDTKLAGRAAVGKGQGGRGRVCVCLCLCVSERDRKESDRVRESKGMRILLCSCVAVKN